MEKNEHEYGGMQFVLVSGLSTKEAGKGIARVGKFNVKSGEVISDADILRSNLAVDLEKAVVNANGAFVLKTTQINYGGPKTVAPSMTQSARPAPVAEIISEKRIEGIQKPVSTTSNVEATLISEKVVAGIQDEADAISADTAEKK